MKKIGNFLGLGLAEGIDDSTSDVLDSATDMSDDVLSAFDNLNTGLSLAIPTSNTVAASNVPAYSFDNTSARPVTISLNITDFNNYSTEDIQTLTNEIMITANQVMARRNPAV